MMPTPDAKRPTPRFMTELERTLLEELKSISADESVLSAGQDQGMFNAVTVDKKPSGSSPKSSPKEEKPAKGKGKSGKNGQKGKKGPVEASADGKKKQNFQNFQKRFLTTVERNISVSIFKRVHVHGEKTAGPNMKWQCWTNPMTRR